ncbi:MAG: AsmA family protein [Planctomycetota bacterium]
MRKKMRRTLWVVAAIVILVIVAAGLAAGSLNGLIRTGVEKGGTAVLGVKTTLEGASASLLGSSLTLRGLALGSPPGFSAPEMFALDYGRVRADVRSLTKDEVRIREVVLDGPELTLEFKGGKTNWGVLREALARQSPEEPAEGAEKKFRVERLFIQNGKVKLAGIPVARSAGIPLPPMEIRDLGTGDSPPMNARKLVSALVAPLADSALAAVQGALSPEELQSLASEARGALEEAGASVGQKMEGTGGILKDAAQKTKKLFGAPADEEPAGE